MKTLSLKCKKMSKKPTPLTKKTKMTNNKFHINLEKISSKAKKEAQQSLNWIMRSVCSKMMTLRSSNRRKKVNNLNNQSKERKIKVKKVSKISIRMTPSQKKFNQLNFDLVTGDF